MNKQSKKTTNKINKKKTTTVGSYAMKVLQKKIIILYLDSQGLERIWLLLYSVA